MYVGAKKGEGFRYWQLVIDIIVMILGTLTVLLGVIVFFDLNGKIQWLPLMFLLAALANLMSGMKSLYYGRKLSGTGLCISSCLILVFALISYVTLWR